jgi:hypothetical protein
MAGIHYTMCPDFKNFSSSGSFKNHFMWRWMSLGENKNEEAVVASLDRVQKHLKIKLVQKTCYVGWDTTPFLNKIKVKF